MTSRPARSSLLPAGRSRARQTGLSLIELMISITLGLIILAALVTVFSQNSRSFRQNDAAAQIQDNARFAMEALSRDLMMAGYRGGVFDATGIVVPTTAPGNDCGPVVAQQPWAFQAATAVDGLNDATSSAAIARFPCLLGIGTVDGTDVLAVRRANAMSAFDLAAGASNAVMSPQTYYLQTNGTQASIVPTDGSGKPVQSSSTLPQQPPMSFFQWLPRLYYIQPYSRSANDGIRALCRMELLGTPSKMTPECLADGIDDMQIEWGLDLDGDGVVDTYTGTLGANQPRTARIWLLVATTQPEVGYVDTKLYSLAGKPAVAPPVTVGIHHRVYSTTVMLRN